jgi:hypothetical protein
MAYEKVEFPKPGRPKKTEMEKNSKVFFEILGGVETASDLLEMYFQTKYKTEEYFGENVSLQTLIDIEDFEEKLISETKTENPE